ncbi:helix-turn-helix domain-containing protein [Chloroflexota bacterium]
MLTVSEVAESLHVHPNTVRMWSNRGLLKAYRIGYRHDRRFRREDIEKLLTGNPPTET